MTPEQLRLVADAPGCGWCGLSRAHMASEGTALELHPRGDSIICARCLAKERERPTGKCSLHDCSAPPLIDGSLCAAHDAEQRASGLSSWDWKDARYTAWLAAQAKAKRDKDTARRAAGRYLEKEVVVASMKALAKEPTVVKVVRMQSGMYDLGEGRRVSSGEPGMADYHVALRVPGCPVLVWLWLEFKGTGEKQSGTQIGWQKKVEAHGDLYRLAHSADEALAAVRGVVELVQGRLRGAA